MKINNFADLESVEVKMGGAKDTVLTILVGNDDGSERIIMRHFKVMPKGHTPHHSHDFEHVVKVEKGIGIVVDEDENEHKISVGNSFFVAPNVMHQFKNPYDEPFEFICVIPGGM